MNIQKMEATVIFVKDLSKSIHFYVDVIGLERTEVSDDFANLKIKDKNIALLGPKVVKELLGKEITNPGFSGLIAAEVDSVDKSYGELKNKVKFIKPPTLQSWGQYTAYFVDPDGHIWEIFEWKHH